MRALGLEPQQGIAGGELDGLRLAESDTEIRCVVIAARDAEALEDLRSDDVEYFLAKDPFGTYLAVGVAAMLALQMFVNVGMTIGIMPITGIPLPFVSYGGTFLLTSWVAVGMAARLAHEE